MKKYIVLKITIFIILIIGSLTTYSQKKDVEKNMFTVDGVEFQHNWKPSKRCNKKSPLQLNVKVKNTNTYHVKVQLQVNYYQSGILQEQSSPITLCIKPKQSKQGGKNGLNFSAGSFTNKQINSSTFTYEVNPIQITKMRSCRKK